MSGTNDPRLTALIAALDAYNIKVQPVPVVIPPPVTTESAEGTTVTPGVGQIIDASNNTWGVSTGGMVMFNFKPDPTTQRVLRGYYKGHEFYQENADHNWWVWRMAWVQASDPTGTVPPPAGNVTPGQWIMQTLNGLDYGLLLPHGYNGSQSAVYPAILFLHQLQNDAAIPQPQLDPWFNTVAFRSKHPAIIIAPKCPNSSAAVNWGGVDGNPQPCQDKALAILASVELRYRVDTNRVYLTGNSMGGIGCWDSLYKHPDLFAAGMPLAGNDYAIDANTVAAKLRDKPIWAFHGRDDSQVPIAFDRAVYARMQAIGGKMRYTELPLGHDVWDTVYPDMNTWDWLFAQSLTSTVTPPGTTGHGLPLASGALYTLGNQIVDINGVPQRLATIGWPQLFDNIDGDAAAIRKLGFNSVRVSYVNANIESDLPLIDKIVAACARNNLRVIIDHHTCERGTPADGWGAQQKNGLPFDVGPGTDGTNGAGVPGTVTIDKFVSDWVRIAQRYKDSTAIVGYDLTNEPLGYDGMATWGDGGARDLRRAYTLAGDAIHKVDPKPLIICEGAQHYGTQRPWGDLAVVKQFPVQLAVKQKVVYSVHDYPQYIAGFTPDSGPAKVPLMEACWGYIVRQNIAPVWIGEMGGDMTTQAQRLWATTLLDYLESFPKTNPNDQPQGGNWWLWGQLDGQLPNGILSDYGSKTPRPEQQPYWARLLFNR